MEAGKRTLGEILNPNRIIEIPFFQRNYVWNEDQWERFINDISYVIDGGTEYYMGPLILKQKSTNSDNEIGDRRTLVDGQQRLTTIMLLFRCFAEKFNEEKAEYGEQLKRLLFSNTTDKSIIMQHNYNDEQTFNAIIGGELGTAFSKDDLQDDSQVYKCYEFLKKEIDKRNDWNYKKCHSLMTKILFIGIDLGEREDEQQMFDTLNSIGVSLTTGELVKNMLFTSRGKDLYESTWREAFEKENVKFWDRIIGAKNLNKHNIDLFLYSYFLLRLNNRFPDNFEKSISEIISKRDDIYRQEILSYNYNKLINHEILKRDDRDILEEIIACSDVYKKNICHERFASTPDTDKAFIDKINIVALAFPVTALIPYLLFIYTEVNEKEQEPMIDLLINYFVRRMTCKAIATDYGGTSGFATLIAKNINTYEALKNELASYENTNNYFPTDEHFANSIKTNFLTNARAKVILYLLELSLKDNKYSTILGEFNRYQLEHIMPKKWETHWQEVANKMKDAPGDVLKRMGNLTLLSSPLNNAIKNLAWQDKKAGNKKGDGLIEYSKDMKIFSEDYLNLKEWNEESINARGEFLAEQALKAWPYPDFKQDDGANN